MTAHAHFARTNPTIAKRITRVRALIAKMEGHRWVINTRFDQRFSDRLFQRSCDLSDATERLRNHLEMLRAEEERHCNRLIGLCAA